MNSRDLYRISLYVMLTLATLVLSIDATGDNRLAMLYPPAVAVVAAFAYLFIDRRAGAGIAQGTARALCLGGFLLTGLEFYYDPTLLVLALGHLLVYMQIVLILLAKTVERDWYLIGVGVAQVVVGGFLSQSDQVGMVLFAWAVTTLWVLSLFYLQREAQRSGVKAPAQATATATVAPAPPATEPYPGLIDRPFLSSTAVAAAVTLALGGVIFLALPRRNDIAYSGGRGDPRGRQHMTGFTETVRLGDLGEMLESEQVVMTVQVSDDATGATVQPDPATLWRGTTLVTYKSKRWRRLDYWSIEQRPGWLRRPDGSKRVLRQDIRLEPTDSEVLFGLRPILRARNNEFNPPNFNQIDGGLIRPDMQPRRIRGEAPPQAKPGSYEYVVRSLDDPGPGPVPQPKEKYPESGLIADLLQIPEGEKPDPLRLRRTLRTIAEGVVRGVPADRPADRARKLAEYLGNNPEFHYSLRDETIDPNVDPIEDFLVNRKRGNCEYYASALTLLLRSIDIPARMANGFKGGDWNNFTGVVTVRQRHAHTWVEALVGREPDPKERRQTMPLWLTLDPTPGDDATKAEDFWYPWRQFTDSVRFYWVFYVVGFNSDRQERVLYQPIRALAADAKRGFAMMGQGATEAADWLFSFRTVGSFFSVRGLVVSVLAMLLLTAVAWLIRRVARKVLARLRARRDAAKGLAAGVAFYRRAAQILADYGLDRAPAETPREFARRAAAQLADDGPTAQAVADVPPLVVDAFYRIRFGRVEPRPEALQHIEGRLDALEATLRGAPR
ncbi:MAG TPA: DUF3488 and transglutaminase-like domain-containing protein [Isosphaeraceae bacterium]|jgi:transglutaminase-like putative cysteine protease|nr:DUF3488 and transglutaminase-like domain-containing protein [Isosphaeraceae bacterium]